MATQLQEVLPKAGLVYSEKSSLSEILSKPKILPLKSITLERIEEMEDRARKIFEDARKPPESSQGSRPTTADSRFGGTGPPSSMGRPSSSAGRPQSSAGRPSSAAPGQLGESVRSTGSLRNSRQDSIPEPKKHEDVGVLRPDSSCGRPSSSSGRRLSDPILAKHSDFTTSPSVVRSATTRPVSSRGEAQAARDQS
eukprot:EG_transcript_26532